VYIYSPAHIAEVEKYKRYGLNLDGIAVLTVSFILKILCLLRRIYLLFTLIPGNILNDPDLKQAGLTSD